MSKRSNIKNFIESTFTKQISAHITSSRKQGEFATFPTGLHDSLKKVLIDQGISSLYTHQQDAFQSIKAGKNTLLVSRTASGKTLSFFLPVLDDYIQTNANFSVMLFYPTKALTRDQESTFGSLMSAVKYSGKIGTFDGDTPRDERQRIQRSSDFILTNPDMLHSGILPNHNRKWKSLLSRLKYIILDEVHIYRGSFGSHVANVFRRLQRVCEIHGSNPVFICSSATVGNPGNHVHALFNKEFTIIDNDGSPQSKKDLYLINPPLVESHGHAFYRKGPGSISIPLIREATKQNVRTICFCRARQEVERLHRSVIDGFPEFRESIKPYRGGLLPNERRSLEKKLASGEINTIITTNALELGIDIGDLELCILSGHPGTIASFWQQAGRVGRKDNNSTIVYIAKDTPIDQFLVNHEDFITTAPVEQALLNADNPYNFLQHLPCAAQEYPLRSEEPLFDKLMYEESIDILKKEKTIVPYQEFYRYALQDYPSRGVNLRGMTDYNVEIICENKVIGEIDPIGARGTLYKDAIYQHLGRKYLSLDLDLDKKICTVEKMDVDYYTEAVWQARIEMTEEDEQKKLNESKIAFGYIYVNKQPKLYKKIRERSYENIGYGPITLPAFDYDTTGFSLQAPQEWRQTLEGIDKRFISSAYYGLGYVLRHTGPLICMADIKDIDSDVSLIEIKDDENETKNFESALFLYDKIEGGVGYAEKIYEKINICLSLCKEIIEQCECTSGCPSCVPPLPPGIDTEELELFLIESNASVVCTLSLIEMLLYGFIIVPKVVFKNRKLDAPVDAPEQDEDRLEAQKKLQRASKILQKKRERLH